MNLKILLITLLLSATVRAQIYVSPTGNDSNTGTITSPYLTLKKALTKAGPDSTVYLRGGTYTRSSTETIGKSGTAGHYVNVFAYPGEIPVWDFSSEPGTNSDGIKFSASYCHLMGLEVLGAAHNGINIQGNYDILENCRSHDNRNSGIQMGSSSSTTYPRGNFILNCDSYRNYDAPIGGNADGFAFKWNIGSGTVFKGCRSWNNSDDGWDLWMADSSVEIDSCFAFRNGVDSWHSGSFNGNGNGFKVGGNFVPTPHTLKNCVSFDNAGDAGRGYDENNNTAGQTLYNCIAFRNLGDNFHLLNTVVSGQHVIRNCVSYVGNVNITSGTRDHNSWNGVTVSSADFRSLDTALAVAPRNPDGSLPINGFLRLVAGSALIDTGINVGLPYTGTTPDLGAFEYNGPTTTYTVATNAVNGTVSQLPVLSAYDAGSSVRLTATPIANYHFVNWSGDTSAVSNPMLLVMNSNKNVTANFASNSLTLTVNAVNGTVIENPNQSVYDSNTTVQLTAVPATGYHFVSWTGDTSGSANPLGLIMNGNKTVTANFAANLYTIGITAVNGSVTKNPDQANYDSNAVVQLTAVPATGYHFTVWSGNASGSATPVSVTMNANKNVTASFSINQFALTVVDSNGTVSVSPNQTVFDSNTVVQLTAIPATGYHFTGWSGDTSGSTNPVSITMNRNKKVTASFSIDQYPIVATAENGSITKNPDQAAYDSNSTVQLTAFPENGYHFTGWGGDASGSANPLNVTMNGPKNINALFDINSFPMAVRSRWNLLSLPYKVSDNRLTTIFPHASTQAYAYAGHYITEDSLLSMVGYWVKFAAPETVTITGFNRFNDSLAVNTGWNMIGSLSNAISVSNIRTSDAVTIISKYYGYASSYIAADTIYPGRGYWVKVSAPGILYMDTTMGSSNPSATSKKAIGQLNTLTITDNNGNTQNLSFGTVKNGTFSTSEIGRAHV